MPAEALAGSRSPPAGGGLLQVPASIRQLPWRWAAYLLVSELTVLALLRAVAAAPARPLIFLTLLLTAVAIPTFLTGTYLSALRRAHGLRLFRDGGRLRRLLSGRVVRSGAWIVLSSALAVAFFVGASGPSRSARGLAFLAPPMLGLIFWLVDRALAGEVNAPHRRAIAARAALVLAPLLLVATDFGAMLHSADFTTYATLSEAAKAALPSEPAKSAVVDELLRLSGYATGIEAFALGRVGDWGGAFRVAAFLGIAALNFTFYAALTRVLSVFLLPWTEIRRGLQPASDDPATPRLSLAAIAAYSAVATVLAVFVAIPLLADAEAWLKANEPPSRTVIILVEEIDGRYFLPGTTAIIEKLTEDTTTALGLQRADLEQAANAGFDAMKGNVDVYLDAYYSLPAEYLRIASLVMGEDRLGQRIGDELNTTLAANNPFGQYEAKVGAALASNPRVQKIYDDAVRSVLEKRSLGLPANAPIEIVRRVSLPTLNLPAPDVVLTTSGERVAAGTLVGGAVAALIVKKLVAKGTLKLASKALVKVALSKAASASGGAGVGAGIGAFVGSAVPVVGTAAGAVVGGVIGGLVVGAGVDYLALKLEEAYSRGSFEQEILDALERQRVEFIAGLSP